MIRIEWKELKVCLISKGNQQPLCVERTTGKAKGVSDGETEVELE